MRNNILDRIIEIEDMKGKTIMVFETDEKGNIVRFENCKVANVEYDYIFDSNKKLVRIRNKNLVKIQKIEEEF